MSKLVIYVCTWDWELRDSAHKWAVKEDRSVVILIQHYYLYGGRILQSLSTGGQREGFKLHTHAHTQTHNTNTTENVLESNITVLATNIQL